MSNGRTEISDRSHSGAKQESVSSGNAADAGRGRFQRPDPPEPGGEYIGLCATCELRKTCDKPKVPGGIWSCNDYSEL